MRMRPGSPYPQGATRDGSGVNPGLFSGHATTVELCLVDGHDGDREVARIPMREPSHQEENQAGTDDNLRCNCDAEGPSDDPLVLALQQQRNLLATVLLPQGVPMLCGGDEIGRPVKGATPIGNGPDALTLSLGLRLAGDAIEEGSAITEDTLLILLNVHHEPVPFTLPAHRRGVKWELLLDTRTPEGRRLRRPTKGGDVYALEARCLAGPQHRRKP